MLGLTLPITIACALFADDFVYVLLGPKWRAATEIVRLLAPTIAGDLAVLNPMTWLINSLRAGAAGPQDCARLRTYHDCELLAGAVAWRSRG